MEPRDRIRKLLVLGDNRLKQGGGRRSLAKAREAYEEALGVARQAGLDGSVGRLVELRLAEIERLEREPMTPSA